MSMHVYVSAEQSFYIEALKDIKHIHTACLLFTLFHEIYNSLADQTLFYTQIYSNDNDINYVKSF